MSHSLTDPSSPPSPYRHRVTFAETDAAGIVHFTNYLKWLEEAEQDFLRSIGVPLIYRDQDQVMGWPRIKVEAEYLRPAFFEDWIEIERVGLKVQASRLTYRFQVFREGQSTREHIANATMQTVFAKLKSCDGQTQVAACLLPDDVLRLLEPWQL